MSFLVLLCPISSLTVSYAQTPSSTPPLTIWENYYGDAQRYLHISALIQTSDDGYAFLTDGASYQATYFNPILYKIDSLGNLQWKINTKLASSAGLAQTSDGSYVIAGNIFYSESYPNFKIGDVSLIKINQNGNLLWNQTFPTQDRVSFMVQTKDSGFILTCNIRPVNIPNASSQVTIIKTDSMGKQEWNNTVGEPGKLSLVNGVIQTDDEGYIFVGNTNVNSTTGQSDFWLAKTDSNGNLIWSRFYSNPTEATAINEGKSVIQTSDGNYTFLGVTRQQNSTKGVVFLGKIDYEGNVIWGQTFQGQIYSSEFTTNSLIATSDGGLAFCESDYGAVIAKTDGLGNLKWNQTFHKEERGMLEFAVDCLIESRDGALVFAGYGTTMPSEQCILTKVDAALPALTPSPTLPPMSNANNQTWTLTIITLLVVIMVALGTLMFKLRKNKKRENDAFTLFS